MVKRKAAAFTENRILFVQAVVFCGP